MIDPMNFHDTPEDVAADEEAHRLEEARRMLEKAKLANRNRARMEQKLREMQKPVIVSVAPGSGKIRRNGPCPCGSGKKFKRCHGDPKNTEA